MKHGPNQSFGVDEARGTGRGQLAIVGDLHSCWNGHDVAYFDRTAYELLLFCGDLGGSVLRDGLRVARSIARIGRPALVMPGNNDAEHYANLAAELTHQRGLLDLLGGSEALRPDLRKAVGKVRVCGYSAHACRVGSLDVTIVTGRPFAMGGSELSFSAELQSSFGVGSLDDSSARLRALVDEARSEHVVFFAHNGPSGLGARPDDPWGADFRPEAGDWGDRDLELAVEHARGRGLRVLAVIAGHMHWSSRRGGRRTWKTVRDGTLYLNPARVPRIFDSPDGLLHHHVALTLTPDGASAEEVLVQVAD